MKRKTKVTMNDIARAAGVSQATVSLVLNQSRNIKLSDETRQRVIGVATSSVMTACLPFTPRATRRKSPCWSVPCKALIRLSMPSARRGKPHGATKRC